MAVVVGEHAPGFALKDPDGKSVMLSDLKGKWVVLYFYPKDDTPGCTLEAVEFTSRQQDFKELGAIVLGVSADSQESHCAFRDKHKLAVRLLSDPQRDALSKYSAYGKKNLYGKVMMAINRSTVLIDPQGIVAYRWKSVKAKGHAKEVLATLRELRKKH